MKKFKFLNKGQISKLPKSAGVYCFKNKEVLYIGKAANLRERVKNHFLQPSYRDGLFLDKIEKIGYLKTNSEIEALILEATLIKKHQPKYNVVWRDDKNYFYVGITKENYPRIFITHQPKNLKSNILNLKSIFVGPFVDGNALKQTLKILRKVFPYRSCKTLPNRPCLLYQLNRCPAPCFLKERVKNECQRNAKNLMKIFQGRKSRVLRNLKKEMKKMSASQNFERAAEIRDQIEALEKILANAKIADVDVRRQQIDWPAVEKILIRILKINQPKFCKAKLRRARIEAYDVSNIQGNLATGSMVTFINGIPDKNFYRRFKIKNRASKGSEGEEEGETLFALTAKPNDVAMLKEVLNRRFKHPEWPFPDLILIDGGKAQLNAALTVLNQHKSVKSTLISVIALAKKENKLFIEGKKEPLLLKTLPRGIFNLILQLRDEAHRFAISYHKKLRKKAMFELAD